MTSDGEKGRPTSKRLMQQRRQSMENQQVQ